jgi:hypothetical protein
MKNLKSKEIETIIKKSTTTIVELQENLIAAEEAGFEFGTSQILSSLPVWGEYPGDTEGIYSWDENRVLDSDFNLIPRCRDCGHARWACLCD